MTNDEMFDMVIMCTQAMKEKKVLQYFNVLSNRWEDRYFEMKINTTSIINIFGNIASGIKYRVKPGPKTVRVRMYWCKDKFGIKGPHVFKTYNISISFEEISKGIHQFYDWAGDEQILTVPEV